MNNKKLLDQVSFLEVMHYNSNSYFNETDCFMIYDVGIRMYKVSRMKLYNGTYYSEDGLKYKATSVPTINVSTLRGVNVYLQGTNIRGSISKAVSGNLGILWEQGQKEFRKGLPFYWYPPKHLIIKRSEWRVTKHLTKMKV
jgi:hypothetical protein